MSGNRQVDAEPTDVGPELYNANDGLFGRNGGPYGDEVDMRTAEYQRAAREGRDPDYENLQPSPAILLQNAAQQTASYNPTLLAGDDRVSLQSVSAHLQAPVVSTLDSGASDSDELPGKDGANG